MINLKFKPLKEDCKSKIFVLDLAEIKYDGSIFNLRNRLVTNLCRKLNKNGFSFQTILNEYFGEFACETCNKKITYSYSRKRVYIKKYCSKTCFANSKKRLKEKIDKYKRKKCKCCGDYYYVDGNHLSRKGACAKKECLEHVLDNFGKNIKKTHWAKTLNKNIIITKRIKTRLNNDKIFDRKYKSWNKDKTGIYSKETIEKMRAGAIRNFEKEIYKKTGIEKIIENFLKEQNLKYKYSFFVEKRQFDFCVFDKKLLVECQGDFWHANPLFYGDGLKKLSDKQILKRKDDEIKKIIAIRNGYRILQIWENDIIKNLEDVKKLINQL